MSAWVCDREHFDVLVKAALVAQRDNPGGVGQPLAWWQVHDVGGFSGWRRLYTLERGDPDEMTPSQLGQMLVSENVRSVHHRYPDTNPDVHPAALIDVTRAMEALKRLDT